MKDEKLIKKNVLSLNHSANQAKASVFLGGAFTSFIAFFVAFKDSNLLISIVFSSIVALIFLLESNKRFNECKKIREDILKI